MLGKAIDPALRYEAASQHEAVQGSASAAEPGSLCAGHHSRLRRGENE